MNVEEMKFVKVYDCLVAKAERKGRTKDEVNQVISWLTGYKKDKFDDMCKIDSTYKDFFDNAPKMNVNRALIKGKICGIQVENIEDSFMIEVRRLDKLIDELAKGKDMSKILRVPGNIDEYISIQKRYPI